MTQRTGFQRKMAYLVVMAVLVLPLWWLSNPRTTADVGGRLAQIRHEQGLDQSSLGEIDPASETMKLATLGLRGVAAYLLWGQANEYKKTENWTKLTATLEQLAKLQPNFVAFWKYQSWNQSYNLSVEFDDYRDRYYYVRRGIEFLEKGESYNKNNPHLLWELGWFLGYKIGRADEKVQYRRLFKADDEYHGDRPMVQRDNWLVGKQWYEQAVRAVDELGRSYDRKSPIVFYSGAPKWQMSYAKAIGDDGQFERARNAWEKGEKEWSSLGDRAIPHTLGGKVRFNDQPRLERRVEELDEKLEGLLPGASEQLVEKIRSEFNKAELAAIAIPEEERNDDASALAYTALRRLKYKPKQLAEWIALKEPSLAKEAMRLAMELETTQTRLRYTKSYKGTANYDYWLTRSQFEQTEDAVEARKLIFNGRRLFKEERKPEEAEKLYREALEKWSKVIEAYPVLLDPDGTTGDDIFIFVYEYYEVLEQNDKQIPDDFPLWEIIRNFDSEAKLQVVLAEHDERMRRNAAARPDAAPGDAEPADESAPNNDKPGDQPEQADGAEEAVADEPETAEADSPAGESAED